tara:strand:+ start:491 stop:1588 length:1098 start_codon:yes stop_codon:yes gene_type:complete
MKTTILYKACFLLLMMPTLIMASNCDPIKAKHSKEKIIKKSFNVNADATFNITNRYGNINVVTWNENRIEIEVTIKVEGNNEDKVNKKLEQLDVAFQSAPHKVTAITVINGNSWSTSWWNKKTSNKVKMEINYVVKMPITNNVELSNDYGSITLDKLEGNAYIHSDYGKITTKELMGDTNVLQFDYSNNCYFEYIESGKITADYSEFTVAKVKNLELKADYTKSIIEVAENVNYNCDYGSLKIDDINNLDGKSDYLTLRLGSVYKNVKTRANYGSIKIDRIASKANNLDINAEFTGITIGYDAAYNFNFNIDIDFASLRGSDGFNFTNKEIGHTGKQYSGYYGSKNSKNLVLIKSEYGSITFKKL